MVNVIVGKKTGNSPGILPAGVVLPYAGTTAPEGWYLCYGQDILRSETNLFNAIGTTYGIGNGSTTFTLPDLRGRVAGGKDDMGGSAANRIANQLNGTTLGGAGGTEEVTLDENSLPNHSHGVSIDIPVSDNSSGDGALAFDFSNPGSTIPASGNTDGVGFGDAHSNLQPIIILNYIIKA